jgi:hypothetical protein
MSTWDLGGPLPDQGVENAANKGAYTQNGLRKWGALANAQESAMADTMRTEWAISELQEKYDTPFSLGLGLYSPHLPNGCPQKYFDLYDRATIPLPVVPDDDLENLPKPIRTTMGKRA